MSVSISRAVFGLWLMLASFAGQAQSWYMTAEKLHEYIDLGRCNLKDQQFSSTWPTGSNAPDRAKIALEEVEGKTAFEKAAEVGDIRCLWAMIAFTSPDYAYRALVALHAAEKAKSTPVGGVKVPSGPATEEEPVKAAIDPEPTLRKDVLTHIVSSAGEDLVLSGVPVTIVADVVIPDEHLSSVWAQPSVITFDETNNWSHRVQLFTDDHAKGMTAISVTIQPRGNYYPLTFAVPLQFEGIPSEGEGIASALGGSIENTPECTLSGFVYNNENLRCEQSSEKVESTSEKYGEIEVHSAQTHANGLYTPDHAILSEIKIDCEGQCGSMQAECRIWDEKYGLFLHFEDLHKKSEKTEFSLFVNDSSTFLVHAGAPGGLYKEDDLIQTQFGCIFHSIDSAFDIKWTNSMPTD